MGRNKKIEFEEIHSKNAKSLHLAVQMVTKQLIKMPRDYVQALICEHSFNFNTMIMRDGSIRAKDKTVGCIAFRLYPTQSFAEIAFCVILTKHQRKGYGKELMHGFLSKLKRYDIQYALTYADNDAIGYFEKQGFEIGGPVCDALPRDMWYQRIFHYGDSLIMSIDLKEIEFEAKYKKNRKCSAQKKSKFHFQSCHCTESFQSEYAISSPPQIITNLSSREYRLLSPNFSMSPELNWRSTIAVGLTSKSDSKPNQIRRPKRQRAGPSSPSPLRLDEPPRKKRKVNGKRNKERTQNIVDQIQEQEQYKVIGIDEYNVFHHHGHGTRLKQARERQFDRSSLTIKLKYTSHCGAKYRLPSKVWEEVSSCIERESLRSEERSTSALSLHIHKIWKLNKKAIKVIIAEMDEKRCNLYYRLSLKPQPNCCFILPFNQTGTGWNIQIFKCLFVDGFGHLWGHNITQSPCKLIKGEPNMFDSFTISPHKSYIELKEEVLVMSKVFQLEAQSHKLPQSVLQDLYSKDYPQLRYCFKSSNPLFRAFIYSFK